MREGYYFFRFTRRRCATAPVPVFCQFQSPDLAVDLTPVAL